MSYLISPTQCTSPPSHHRTERMKRRLKQHKLPHDEETEAPTLPYSTLLIFCTFQINIHETNNKKKKGNRTLSHYYIFTQVFHFSHSDFTRSFVRKNYTGLQRKTPESFCSSFAPVQSKLLFLLVSAVFFSSVPMELKALVV